MNNKTITTAINTALNNDNYVLVNTKGLQEIDKGFLVGFYPSEESSIRAIHTADVEHYLTKENSVMRAFTNGYLLVEKTKEGLNFTEVLHFSSARIPITMSSDKKVFSIGTNKWL